jgi:queuine tRNA-ribosyltransferase
VKFTIDQKMPGTLGRAGRIETAHGAIETPAFVVVGTKATVKAVTPEQVRELGGQVVLANTYHLYLQPGSELIHQAGGIHNFMNWPGPTMTDSGGFQVFSLGAAFGQVVSKVGSAEAPVKQEKSSSLYPQAGSDTTEDFPVLPPSALAKVDDEGVTFKSHIDGSTHRLTPERSIEIQHQIGADIIFAFDECTSPQASREYQVQALARTHAWAKRSLAEHQKLGGEQALYGIIQGGNFKDLREQSAKLIGGLGFDGFGIGGSFTKEDIGTAVAWVNQTLPEDKPRHLLGIGEPEDLFAGVEQGVDTFDCVIPTRMARHGQLFTSQGKLNILNAKFRTDFTPIESGCGCQTCKSYTRAYLAHLFRAKEMLAGTLASIHNLYFLVNLTKQIRQSILDDSFAQFKKDFLIRYQV